MCKSKTMSKLVGRKFMEEKNSYPEKEGFQQVIEKYYDIYSSCSELLLKLCAVGLSLPVNYFSNMFVDEGQNKHISTFRILHYPPKVGRKNLHDTDIPISTPAHYDGSILTLLCTFDNYGLQVKNKTDEWIWVEPVDDSLVVNLGSILQSMSNGMLPATIHRVMDLGQDRYSAPMFVEPCYANESYAKRLTTNNFWTGWLYFCRF